MSKTSQIERAIQNLRAKRDVLDLAIQQLEAQHVKTPKPAKIRKAPRPGAV